MFYANRILLLISFLFLFVACKNQEVVDNNQPSLPADFSLDTLQRDAFNYFWEEANDSNGLIPDRSPTETYSSIAATGFGLTCYLIGIENGYITRDQAVERVLKTLKFFWQSPQSVGPSGINGYKGFFYHFLDMDTGNRFEEVELSTIDTGLLMAGVLSCQTYFDHENEAEAEIRAYADSLYRRVEWDWAMHDDGLMSMGWHPESGFIDEYWRGYNEAMILLILALGSPTHPIAGNAWEKWTETYEWKSFYDYEYINFAPLFGHQYSHMYIDFRGIQDAYTRQKGIDYFENSRRATLANRAYCIDNPGNFAGYGENSWGLTACDGPGLVETDSINYLAYWARGAAATDIKDDGTIAPTAAGGSIPFAPEECIMALEHLYEVHGDELYGRYGFRDAFNQTLEWYDQDYLGIDQGPIVIQIQNFRNEFLWELMQKNKYVIAGLNKAGFRGGWLDTIQLN